MTALLRRLHPQELPGRSASAIDSAVVAPVEAIIRSVREGGEPSLRTCAERWDGLPPEAPLLLSRSDLEAAAARVSSDTLALLTRCAGRIRAFAEAQRDCLRPLSVNTPGGACGHDLVAVDRAGCYAPGGRYPLPSSVLMTAVTARAAGVEQVWVATPRPGDLMLAAAAVAGADGVLCAGGAHAIAALAYGVVTPRCDVIAGPGNKWVTAAKAAVFATVGIDMLAGPSELVVLADGRADPEIVAADLLAQAEHDDDAIPWLVTPDADLAARVDGALARRLENLPTAATARRALANGGAIIGASLEECIQACDVIAPEHLEILTADADAVARRVRHAGAVFIGPASAEVLGDYGAGPNHVLPTGGSARYRAGLSVYTFLRARTWMRQASADAALLADTAALARLEGLEAHARAAELRAGSIRSSPASA